MQVAWLLKLNGFDVNLYFCAFFMLNGGRLLSLINVLYIYMYIVVLLIFYEWKS
jgi:hypothetical protein